jgi:hypothetical protein
MSDMQNLGELIAELIKENRYDEIAPLLPEFQKLVQPMEQKDVIQETTTYLEDLKARIE